MADPCGLLRGATRTAAGCARGRPVWPPAGGHADGAEFPRTRSDRGLAGAVEIPVTFHSNVNTAIDRARHEQQPSTTIASRDQYNGIGKDLTSAPSAAAVMESVQLDHMDFMYGAAYDGGGLQTTDTT